LHHADTVSATLFVVVVDARVGVIMGLGWSVSLQVLERLMIDHDHGPSFFACPKIQTLKGVSYEPDSE
jgi:hypothetical protein